MILRQGVDAHLAGHRGIHRVGGRHRGGRLNQIGNDLLDILEWQPVCEERAHVVRAGSRVGLVHPGSERLIELGFGGIQGGPSQVDVLRIRVAAIKIEQGLGQVAIGDLHRIAPIHGGGIGGVENQVGIGGIGREGGEHRRELRTRRNADVIERHGGLGSHPRIRLECLVEAAAQRGQGAGGLEQAEGRAGTLALVDIGTLGQGYQVVDIRSG